MKKILILLLISLQLMSGCLHLRPVEKDDSDRVEDYHNSLWKNGYGFNNPNAERIRKGEKPVGFSSNDDSDDSRYRLEYNEDVEDSKHPILEGVGTFLLEIVIIGSIEIMFNALFSGLDDDDEEEDAGNH